MSQVWDRTCHRRLALNCWIPTNTGNHKRWNMSILNCHLLFNTVCWRWESLLWSSQGIKQWTKNAHIAIERFMKMKMFNKCLYLIITQRLRFMRFVHICRITWLSQRNKNEPISYLLPVLSFLSIWTIFQMRSNELSFRAIPADKSTDVT